MHTLLYIRPSSWWLVVVYSRLVDVSSRLVDVSSRLVVVSFRLVLVSFLVAGVGVLPGGWWMPSGWWCQRRQHIAAEHPCGQACQLLSAAGSLAPESKLQGEIDRCDYSYYQLFRCSFWVCFYIAVYRLKH